MEKVALSLSEGIIIALEDKKVNTGFFDKEFFKD